jgi:hypothetical protein
MAILRRALLALLTALAGCAEPTPLEFSAERLAVHSVLHAGATEALVLLTRVRPPADPASHARYEPLSGAEVLVLRGADTLRLHEGAAGFRDCRVADEGPPATAPGAGCYAARFGQRIRSGERFELRVRLPAGGTVRGAVVIPPAPELLAPEPGARVEAVPGSHPGGSATTLDVRWRPQPEAGRLELTVFSLQGGCGVGVGNTHPEVNFVLLPHPGAAHAALPFTYARCLRDGAPVPWDSFPAAVRVTAYDTAYARYAREVLTSGWVPVGRASAGVEGALGVFAGAAAVERPIHIVPRR